jgi:hypothetical protein
MSRFCHSEERSDEEPAFHLRRQQADSLRKTGAQNDKLWHRNPAGAIPSCSIIRAVEETMNVFGPPLATYGPRKLDIVVFALLAAGAFWLAWLALQQQGPDKEAGLYEAVFCVVVGMLLAALALWNARRRVVLYPEGLTYSTVLGEKQIRWDSLDRFYYQATRQSINFIPVGTYYWFRFIGSEGQRIRFGGGLTKTADLAGRLIELAQGPLLKRIATQFDSGADVDFGPIRINRQGGISVRKSFGRVKQIPWSEVHSYAIQRGHFYIWRIGEKRTTGPAIAKVPNAFALHALLDIIFKSPESA